MMKTETEFNRICQEVRMLTKSGHLTNGWNFLILNELRRLNENIETILSYLSTVEVDKTDSTKTPAMIEIEKKFGKSISELLQERKDKSVRQIADEFGISKTTISDWRQRYTKH